MPKGTQLRAIAKYALRKAAQLKTLEDEMAEANTEYIQATNRASKLHLSSGMIRTLITAPSEELHYQIADVLRTMLNESETTMNSTTNL